MSVHHERYRAERARQRSVAYLTLFVAAVFMVLAGMILAFYFIPDPSLLLGGKDPKDTDRHVEVTLEDTEFELPVRYLERVNRGLLSGPSQIDLRLPWPFDEKSVAAEPQSPQDVRAFVLISILPRGDQITPEERFESIYKVYFSDSSRDPTGLTNYRFKPDAPYADSELFVDERVLPQAVIRCDLKPSVLGPVLCERIARLGEKLVLRVRFARTRLGEWQAIYETASGVVAEAVKRH
jgi:hypothetical protein